MFGLCVDLKGFYIKASAALRLACPRVEYSDAKVANRLGLARGDIKWSLNEGQRPRSRGVRKIPDVTIRNFLIAVLWAVGLQAGQFLGSRGEFVPPAVCRQLAALQV
jgi:predicted unusual protein kinase regulating ubiquinone biosynthesis (AarF/ABC1/UbiB family)